jgi:hypothetical protein
VTEPFQSVRASLNLVTDPVSCPVEWKGAMMYGDQVWACAMALSLDLFNENPHVLTPSMPEARFHLFVGILLNCESYQDNNFVTKVVNQIGILVCLVLHHKNVVR